MQDVAGDEADNEYLATMGSIVDFALSIQILVWVTLGAAFLASRQFSLYHPNTFYFFFHGLVFVLRPILVRYGGLDDEWKYMRFTPTDEEFIKTLAASTLALLVFVPLCWLRTQTSTPLVRGFSRPMSKGEVQAVLAVALMLAPLGIYSIIKYPRADSAGGFDHGVFVLTKASGYLLDAKNLLAPTCILIFVASRFRWWGLIPLLVYLACRILLGTSRWSVIMPTATLLLIYFFQARNAKMALTVSALVVVGAFVLFALMGAARVLTGDILAGNHVASKKFNENTLFRTVSGPDFANFDFLAYIVSTVPERSGGSYSYFTDVLGLLITPIPRTLWPDKPVTGEVFNLVDLNGGGRFTGRTESVVGAGWIALGWPGIVLTMIVVAAFLSRIYRRFVNDRSNMRVQLAYFMFIPLTLQWFRDGGFVSIAKFSLWSVGPIFCWILLARMFCREPLLGRKSPAGQPILQNPEWMPRVRR